MKMEDVGAILVIALLCAAGAWLIGSFINWNFDPRDWSELDRAAVTGLALYAYAKVTRNGGE
jgi:hypothetical protein